MPELPVIFNPAADRGRAGARANEVLRELKARGFAPVLLTTTKPGEATEMARELVRKRAPVLAAAGGDGTLNEVAQALVGTSTALGIIPMGSGNDFLRSLVGSVDFAGALRHLAEGKPVPVDVGEANGRFYLNSLGMGIDGQIAEDFTRWKFLRGELGYLWAALYEAARFRPFHLRIRSDAGSWELQGLMISVMNGSHTAGGFHLAPGAALTDGALNLIAIRHYPRIARVPILVKVRQGKHLGLRGVKSALVQWVEVQTSRPLRVYVDGELLPRTDRLSIRIHPRSLLVVL
ncbi:MAG: diacylglycerol kinase family lipid kinase [Candidatus Bipolaricaulota bacterium]|nr:diacylglycerol kinase family lipid kinase [Candidatus Bipolaricaulota bacterium]MDW8126801.1 diacylglycerol kinase family lipid kinase [Candidatus Bipolaricaulota bacterium]